MIHENRGGLAKDVAYGFISGLVGTFVMDKATTAMYGLESEKTKKRESELMKEPAYTILARRVAEKSGSYSIDQHASKIGELLHWAYGVFWGALYGALHDRAPAVSKARGLLYAITVFAFGDEGLNTLLKISPSPRKFPLAVHLRGLFGHIVYATAVDRTYNMLKKAA